MKAGVGKLIAGWDAALLTMSVGEKAVVTIPPEHAYGSKGFPTPRPLFFQAHLALNPSSSRRREAPGHPSQCDARVRGRARQHHGLSFKGRWFVSCSRPKSVMTSSMSSSDAARWTFSTSAVCRVHARPTGQAFHRWCDDAFTDAPEEPARDCARAASLAAPPPTTQRPPLRAAL